MVRSTDETTQPADSGDRQERRAEPAGDGGRWSAHVALAVGKARAHQVRRNQIGGELNASETSADDACQRLDRGGSMRALDKSVVVTGW